MKNTHDRDPVLVEENMDSYIDDDENLSPMSPMSLINLQWTDLESLVELDNVDTDKQVGDLEVISELKVNHETSIYPSKTSNNSTWSINDDCKYFDNQCHNIGENDKPDNEEIQQVDLTVSSEQKTSSHTHIDGLLEQNSYVMESDQFQTHNNHCEPIKEVPRDTAKCNCWKCDKMSFKRRNIYKHNRSHNMMRHLVKDSRISTGQNKHVITILRNVNKTMNGKSSVIKYQMRKNGNRRLYECQMCNKQFNRKPRLFIHMKCYHKIKQYVCDYCCKVFPTKGKLKNHIEVHKIKVF